MEYNVWCGPEESYTRVQTIQEEKLPQLMARMGGGMFDMELPSLLTKEGNVGIVQMHGDLIAGKAGWMRIFGVVGYAEVAEALMEAVGDTNVKSIVLDIKSPGGDVMGVDEMAQLIANVGEVKPVNVYAHSVGSAAYWAASAGGHITLNEAGTAGSIGAVIVHRERSKMNEEMGIKTTVIRSGPYKMVSNSVEPLAREGAETLQNLVDYAAGRFVQAVSQYRNVPANTVDTRMGQGRIFPGVQAKEVGLVDAVGTLQDAITYSTLYAKAFKPKKSVK